MVHRQANSNGIAWISDEAGSLLSLVDQSNIMSPLYPGNVFMVVDDVAPETLLSRHKTGSVYSNMRSRRCQCNGEETNRAQCIAHEYEYG